MSLRDRLGGYGTARIWRLTLLGFSSGLPLYLSGGTLKAWMSDSGLDLTTVGLFTAAQVPYSLKFLWAPLMDRYPAPLFGRLGRRRGWLALTQTALMVALAAMSATGPTLPTIAALAAGLAFLSASQDIVADAYRTDVLTPEERGPGTGTFVTGYRLGMLVAQSGALILADVMGWSWVYALMSGLMAVGLVTTLRMPNPPPTTPPRTLAEAFVDPFVDFFRRRGAISVLVFLTLYKLGDVVAGAVNIPFLKEIGFSNTEIGVFSKIVQTAATVIGGLIGGGLIQRYGLFAVLFIFGIAQAVTNLCYTLLAVVGKDPVVMMAGVTLDQICGGFAMAAVNTFVLTQCNPRFSATQFALLTSAAGLTGHIVGSSSGAIATWLGWPAFFAFTMVLGLPALVLLWRMRATVSSADVTRRDVEEAVVVEGD